MKKLAFSIRTGAQGSTTPFGFTVTRSPNGASLFDQLILLGNNDLDLRRWGVWRFTTISHLGGGSVCPQRSTVLSANHYWRSDPEKAFEWREQYSLPCDGLWHTVDVDIQGNDLCDDPCLACEAAGWHPAFFSAQNFEFGQAVDIVQAEYIGGDPPP